MSSHSEDFIDGGEKDSQAASHVFEKLVLFLFLIALLFLIKISMSNDSSASAVIADRTFTDVFDPEMSPELVRNLIIQVGKPMFRWGFRGLCGPPHVIFLTPRKLTWQRSDLCDTFHVFRDAILFARSNYGPYVHLS